MSEVTNKSVIELPPSEYSRKEERALPAIANATPVSILALAVQRGDDIEKLTQLMALAERWEANEARKAFNAAFAAFKTVAVRILRNKSVVDGPLKGKSYAELFSIVDAVTPALSAQGLSASWRLSKDEKDWIEVTCTLKHVMGHAETVAMGGPPDAGGAKNAIQARASTVTYLEKYTLKAVCGVSEQGDDNDGGKRRGEPEPDAAGKAALEACGSLSALQAAWKALTAEQRKTLDAVKDDAKARIQEADGAAAA